MPEVVDVKAMSDDEFVKKYKKLVYKFVWRKYGAVLESIKTTTGLDVEDLIQSGMIGLLKARRDFNSAYGCKLGEMNKAERRWYEINFIDQSVKK